MGEPSAHPLQGDGAPGAGTGGQTPSVLVWGKTADNKDNGPLPRTCIGYIGKLLSQNVCRDFGVVRPNVTLSGAVEVLAKNKEIASKIMLLRGLKVNNTEVIFKERVPGKIWKGKCFLPRAVGLKEEVLEEVKAQPNIKDAKIANEEDISKSGKRQESYMILINFNTDVPFPARIAVWGAQIYVHEYVPNPRQCYKCLKFGHIAVNCWGKERCLICAEAHNFRTCPSKDESNPPKKCSNCNEAHTANSRDCKLYKEKANKLRTSVINGRSFSQVTTGQTTQATRPTGLANPQIPYNAFPPLICNHEEEILKLRKSVEKLTKLVTSLCSILLQQKDTDETNKELIRDMADELSSDEDPSDIVMSTSESEDKGGVGNACKRAKLGNRGKGKEKVPKNNDQRKRGKNTHAI